MRQHSKLSRTLGGGDRRSIGNSNEVAAEVLRKPATFAELVWILWDADPVVRMRAADAAEKVSVKRPELLTPFKGELLGLAEETRQAELRWHLALMLPRLPLTARERDRATAILHGYLEDRSSIVKTCAIEGLALLAEGNSKTKTEMTALLQEVCRTGTPAMKARSRKLLKRFQTM